MDKEAPETEEEVQGPVRVTVETSDGLTMVYVRVREGKVHRTVEVNDEINIDLDDKNKLLGVETITFGGGVGN